MPAWFLYVFLAIAVVAGTGRRYVLRHRSGNARATWPEIVLVVLGAFGLAYHCGAMFFTTDFRGVLGLGGYAHTINALGAWSMVAFSVPALLLLVGARNTPRWYGLLVAAVLAAVGVTMYDDGPLDAHLSAIMLAAIVLIAGLILLTDPPIRRTGPKRATTG